MQRLLVILLAAFDAAIAVAVGVAVALAPLTLLWVFGMGDPQWSALWPAAGTVWQLGHLVPLSVSLPGGYLVLTGIPADAASFTLSLAPLAFAGFTAIFAACSGARAARAGAWITGVTTGTLGVAVLSGVIALTCRNPVATVDLWPAVLLPTLVYALAALAGALVVAWPEGGGALDRVRDRLGSLPGEWDAAPGLIARGSAIALTGLVGMAALAVVVALVLRGGDVIALFETGHVDVLGATVITLGQLAYLPTFVVWALAFIAGPGFAIGIGTAVSPAGTQLGVVPAIPLLGAVPESSSPWLLTVVLLPVIVGGIAGWAVRARVPPDDGGDAAGAVPVHPALAGLVPEGPHAPERDMPARLTQPFGLLAIVAVGIALVAGAGAGLLAFVAAGSLGPARLAETGPSAGPVALAVGVEILVGAAIVLLTTRYVPRRTKRTPRRADDDAIRGETPDTDAPAREPDAEVVVAFAVPEERPRAEASGSLLDDLRARVQGGPNRGGSTPESTTENGNSESEVTGNDADDTDTAPIELPDRAALAPRRPPPLPPVD